MINFLISSLILFSCNSKILDNYKSDEKPSIATVTEQKIAETSIQDAIAWLEENKNSKDYIVKEAELNALGYKLLYDLNHPHDALSIFNINIELFPSSSNAYDSAGEALLIIGEYQKSIDYYRKAIDLNSKVLFHQLGYLQPKPYRPTILPNDVTKLFVQEGNWGNDIAFVYLQGGPDLQLNIGPRDGLHLMPNEKDLLKIYPYQGQMLNPNFIACEPRLTAEQSAFENAQSVEILDRVIKYLVDNKKRVFLIGHSYGASICMEYVNAKDNLAEKVVLMGLDLDEDISSWENLEPGEYIRWEEGQRPYARVIFGNIPIENPIKLSFDRVADNLTMIVKNNMQKKYTQLYKDDDFKKIISVYSTYDEANGRKSAEEKDFIKRKGTSVVEIQGDHHDMLNTAFMTALYKQLIMAKPLADKY